MSDYTRRNEADELREQLNNCREYIAELEMKCNDLREELHKANLAIEHNSHKEALKKEIAYRHGMIDGLKYAIRHNRTRDGKVNQ